MKIVKPKYYDQFKCIADKCPDSCCIGWRIDVDKESMQKYRHVQGKIREKLNKCIKRNRSEEANNETYGKIMLDENLRCSFLTKDNLCEIYIELGEQNLCTVCKVYPRRLYQFNNFCERSLTISCPEVAHMILSQKEPIEFILVDEILTELDYKQLVKVKLDLETQLILNDLRLLFVVSAQNRTLPVWKRLLIMKKQAEIIDIKIKNKTYDEKYLEILYNSLEDKRMIKSLELLDVDYITKDITLNALTLYVTANSGVSRDIEEIITKEKIFRQKITSDAINIEQIDPVFNEYMREKDYIFEHYIVYYLFSHFMLITDINVSVSVEIIILIIYYSLLRYFMKVVWYSQDQNLAQEDIEKIVYAFSRCTEHNLKLRKNLKESSIMQTLESINCCSILLR